MQQKDITIGIITAGCGYKRNLNGMVESILNSLPESKIIIVGGDNNYQKISQITHLSFDENIKDKWITKKKNLIAQNCETQVLVMCHDYIEFPENWFDGWNSFGWEWDFAGNIVTDIDGNRYTDLNSINHPQVRPWTKVPLELCTEENFKYCYLSGAYWLTKTEFLLQVPLNENLLWGMGEDVEWCNRAKLFGKIKFNTNVVVKHNIRK